MPIYNFALMIPPDVSRHKSGNPIQYISPEQKKEFIKYCEENNITDDNTTWEERDELFLEWKNKMKIL